MVTFKKSRHSIASVSLESKNETIKILQLCLKTAIEYTGKFRNFILSSSFEQKTRCPFMVVDPF